MPSKFMKHKSCRFIVMLKKLYCPILFINLVGAKIFTNKIIPNQMPEQRHFRISNKINRGENQLNEFNCLFPNIRTAQHCTISIKYI